MENNSESGPYLAELPRRAVATALDYFLFSFFYALFIISFGKSEIINGRPEYYVEGALKVVPFIVWFLTFPLMESAEGRTIGKRLLRMQVVRLDGQRLTLVDCMKRRVLDWVDFALLGLPSIISSKNSATRQRLGDRWAGTTVVDWRSELP